MSVRLSTVAAARLLGAHVTRACRASAPLRVSSVSVGRRRSASARRDQRLGEAEVEHLDLAVGRDLDIRRLQIAMDDARLVRGVERLGNLPRRCLSASASGRPASMRSASVSPFDELQDECREHRRVLECRRSRRCADGSARRARALRARSAPDDRGLQAISRQDLDGDVAAEPVSRAR